MDHNLFTNRDSVTKSLSFELIPQGRTKLNIEENHVMEYEADLAEASDKLTAYYDQFYRQLIDRLINAAQLPVKLYFTAYKNRSTDPDKYEETKEQVFKSFHVQMMTYIEEKYQRLDRILDGTFVKDIFPDWAKKNLSFKDHAAYSKCKETAKNCDVYFKKYRVSRKTIFSDSEHNTIASRLVLDNMPAFFANAMVWESIKDQISLTEVDEDVFDVDSIMKYMNYEGIEEYNYQIGKANQLINLHNQKNDASVKMFRSRLSQQILTEKETGSWKPICTNEELKSALLTSIAAIGGNKASSDDLFNHTAMTLLSAVKERDLNKIYINGTRALSFLSHVLTGNWKNYKEKFKESGISLSQEHYSLMQLKDVHTPKDSFGDDLYAYTYEFVNDCIKSMNSLNEKLKDQEPAECNEYIQMFFDAFTEFRRFIKNFIPKNLSDLDYDAVFYEEITSMIEELDELALSQSRIKSYMTQSPKDTSKKTRHCFGNPSIYSAGWNNVSDAKVAPGEQFLAVKDGKIFYGKAAAGTKGIPVSDIPSKNSYEKFSFIRIVNAHMQLPKWIFSKSIKEEFAKGVKSVTRYDLTEDMTITKKQFDSYSSGEFRTKKEALTSWIDLCKEYIRISPNFQRFDIDVSAMKDSSEYENLNEFYTEINAKTYKMYKQYIDADTLEHMIDNGEAYLFMLYSTGRMYGDNCSNDYANILKYILSDKCMKKGDVRLNSDVEVTFRAACKSRKVTHPEGSVLVNKIDIYGEPVPEGIYEILYNYYNGRNTILGEEALAYESRIVKKAADRNLIKDRRYTEDKWIINMSYKLNPNPEKKGKLNEVVREAFHTQDSPNILTVIRGEKNLLYYTLTGKNLDERGSLNVINECDYGKILKDLSSQRKEAQKNWDYSKKVVNYKDTYIAQAASFIVKKAIANDAIICIEDIDKKFKQKRMCIDNQVYQKFEDVLVKRLSCFSDPHIPMGDPGSMVNPLQLASTKYTSWRQNGILFRVNPSRTAQADKETGFINLFKFGEITTLSEKKDFIRRFKSISVDNKNEVSLSFNYADFDTKQLGRDYDGYDREWELCPFGFRNVKNSAGHMQLTDIQNLWKMIFVDQPHKNENMIDTILDNDHLVRKAFELIQYSLQSKYVDDEGNEWYISPVTGRREDFSEHSAKMLQRKFERYILEDNTYTTSDWIGSLTE